MSIAAASTVSGQKRRNDGVGGEAAFQPSIDVAISRISWSKEPVDETADEAISRDEFGSI